ncbi:MAG: hypothetical protein ACOH10_07895 [Rhodoglobus sp.]
MRIKKSIQERMAAIGWDEVPRVETLGPCWEWRGAMSTSGYGRVATGGRMGSVYAHRQALSDSLGRPLHPGMIACHLCDNRRCINPAHLYEGTYASNALDAAAAKARSGVLPVKRKKAPTLRQQFAKAILAARDYVRATIDLDDDGMRAVNLQMMNDATGKELATFTRYGMNWLELVLDQHRCGKGCEGGCAVRHVAWIIAGCPTEVDGEITTTPNSYHAMRVAR